MEGDHIFVGCVTYQKTLVFCPSNWWAGTLYRSLTIPREYPLVSVHVRSFMPRPPKEVVRRHGISRILSWEPEDNTEVGRPAGVT